MLLADLVGFHVLDAFGTYRTGASAADWLINDIKIGNRSQLAQSGDLPGDLFATTAIDAFISLETVQTAMDLVLTVTNVGEAPAPFYGSFIGRSVDHGAREVLPMNSFVAIPPGSATQITARPQRIAFRPERLMISDNKEEHVLLALDGALYDFSDYGNVIKIEDEENRDAFLETMMPVLEEESTIIFLRLHSDTLLYGVSERNGLVVFEAGEIRQQISDEGQESAYEVDEVGEVDEVDDDAVYGPLAPHFETKHFLRFDLAGFVPDWLPASD